MDMHAQIQSCIQELIKNQEQSLKHFERLLSLWEQQKSPAETNNRSTREATENSFKPPLSKDCANSSRTTTTPYNPTPRNMVDVEKTHTNLSRFPDENFSFQRDPRPNAQKTQTKTPSPNFSHLKSFTPNGRHFREQVKNLKDDQKDKKAKEPPQKEKTQTQIPNLRISLLTEAGLRELNKTSSFPLKLGNQGFLLSPRPPPPPPSSFILSSFPHPSPPSPPPFPFVRLSGSEVDADSWKAIQSRSTTGEKKHWRILASKESNGTNADEKKEKGRATPLLQGSALNDRKADNAADAGKRISIESVRVCLCEMNEALGVHLVSSEAGKETGKASEPKTATDVHTADPHFGSLTPQRKVCPKGHLCFLPNPPPICCLSFPPSLHNPANFLPADSVGERARRETIPSGFHVPKSTSSLPRCSPPDIPTVRVCMCEMNDTEEDSDAEAGYSRSNLRSSSQEFPFISAGSDLSVSGPAPAPSSAPSHPSSPSSLEPPPPSSSPPPFLQPSPFPSPPASRPSSLQSEHVPLHYFAPHPTDDRIENFRHSLQIASTTQRFSFSAPFFTQEAETETKQAKEESSQAAETPPPATLPSATIPQLSAAAALASTPAKKEVKRCPKGHICFLQNQRQFCTLSEAPNFYPALVTQETLPPPSCPISSLSSVYVCAPPKSPSEQLQSEEEVEGFLQDFEQTLSEEDGSSIPLRFLSGMSLSEKKQSVFFDKERIEQPSSKTDIFCKFRLPNLFLIFSAGKPRQNLILRVVFLNSVDPFQSIQDVEPRIVFMDEFLQKKRRFLMLPDQFRESTEHLVQRLRGGELLKIPKKILPKIDFILEDEDNLQQKILSFSTFTKKLLDGEKLENNENPTIFLDLTKKVDPKKIISLFSALSASTDGIGATIVIALRAPNIPRNPLSFLRRDTRASVNCLKPHVHTAFLHLSESNGQAFVVYLASKIAPPNQNQKILLSNGITSTLSGGGSRTYVEAVCIASENNKKYKDLCAMIAGSDEETPETTIQMGKRTDSETTMYRFCFACKNENLPRLQNNSSKSLTAEANFFWIAPISILDSQTQTEDFLRVSFSAPHYKTARPLVDLSILSKQAAQETDTYILALLPHDHNSLLVVVRHSSPEFYSHLLKTGKLQVQELRTSKASFIAGNCLMIYPVPTHAGGQNSLSLEKLKEAVRPLFPFTEIEVKRNGLRVLCSSEQLDTWRTFSGFIYHQKVKMCKEKENDASRKAWWDSLSEGTMKKVNLTRESFLACLGQDKPNPFPSPISTSSAKRPRTENESGTSKDRETPPSPPSPRDSSMLHTDA